MIMEWWDKEGWLNSVFLRQWKCCCWEWEIKDNDGNDIEVTSGLQNWGVQHARLGIGKSRFSVIFHRIETLTSRIKNGKLICTRNSLKSQFLMLIPQQLLSLSFSSSTIPSPNNTNLSHPVLSLHAMIKSWHEVQRTPSTAFTEYSIRRVLPILSGKYTAYCIIPRSTVSRFQPVSHLLANHVGLSSLYSHNYM